MERNSRGDMKTINYINLTNGIERIPELTDYRFIRIQSTHCEQKRWDDILRNLSDDFILNVLLGNEINIYDYGANKEIPRAVYQGVEWIKYVLNLYYLGIEVTPFVRKHNCLTYFQECYKLISDETFRKLSYHRKYTFTKKINVNCITSNTKHDGDSQYYGDILRSFT